MGSKKLTVESIDGVTLKWNQLIIRFEDIEDLLSKLPKVSNAIGRDLTTDFDAFKKRAACPEHIHIWSESTSRTSSA